MVRVLFVCMANICRSPAAEAIFSHLVAEAGLENEIEVDSAGIIDQFAGEPADPNMAAAAETRGYRLSSLSRQVHEDDFSKFDRILIADRLVYNVLATRARNDQDRSKFCLMGDYQGQAEAIDIPDPYMMGPGAFEDALDVLERVCRNLLDEIVGDSASSSGLSSGRDQ